MLFAQLDELATIFTSVEPKPNMGHLEWADPFVITADSISMLSEACPLITS
jgi:mitochondrial fission protein ELM1